MLAVTADPRSCSNSVLADRPISITVLNGFATLENVCLTLTLSPFSFVKTQEMPGTIFGQTSKTISVIFGLKLFWCKKWGKTYLVLLEVKTGGWENLFASMEKHACFWRINKDGWSYLEASHFRETHLVVGQFISSCQHPFPISGPELRLQLDHNNKKAEMS